MCTWKRKTGQAFLRATAEFSEFWSEIRKAGGTAWKLTFGEYLPCISSLYSLRTFKGARYDSVL